MKNSGKVARHTDPAAVEVPPYYPDHPVIRREIAHHYDCIKQTDDEVGGILAALERDGLLDDTIVFFRTDHGMRLYRHKQWLYEGGIRVPLVIAGPGVSRGKVRSDLISGIDITATTLALAGVKVVITRSVRNGVALLWSAPAESRQGRRRRSGGGGPRSAKAVSPDFAPFDAAQGLSLSNGCGLRRARSSLATALHTHVISKLHLASDR